MRKLTASADAGPEPEQGPGRWFAVPYDRGRCCSSCLDVLRGCCGRDDGDDAPGDGLCCECSGWSHTSSTPGQVVVSPATIYL